MKKFEIVTEMPRLTDDTATGLTLPGTEWNHAASVPGSLVGLPLWRSDGSARVIAPMDVIHVKDNETRRVWCAIYAPCAKGQRRLVILSHLQQF